MQCMYTTRQTFLLLGSHDPADFVITHFYYHFSNHGQRILRFF